MFPCKMEINGISVNPQFHVFFQATLYSDFILKLHLVWLPVGLQSDVLMSFSSLLSFVPWASDCQAEQHKQSLLPVSLMAGC